MFKYNTCISCSEKQKDIRAKRKEDKEYIHNYIKEELIPYTIDKYNFKEKKGTVASEKEIQQLLHDFCLKLFHLRRITKLLSYYYMEEYFELLELFVYQSKNLSLDDLILYFTDFSYTIHSVLLFLPLDENKYQEEALKTMEVFIDDKGRIRNFTLEFLKEFPEYLKHAINYIEELEKK